MAGAKRLGLVVGVVGGENTHECLANEQIRPDLYWA